MKTRIFIFMTHSFKDGLRDYNVIFANDILFKTSRS